MSKVLFFGVPAHGHTNPSLGLVEELVRRGETVLYYSFPEFRDKIVATGAVYRESKGDWGDIDQAYLVSRLSYLYEAIIEAATKAIESCIETIRAEKPDYVIHDSLASWGKFAAQATQTPSVGSISTFLYRSGSADLKTKLNFLLKIKPRDLGILRKARKHVRLLRKLYGITETSFLEILNNTSPLNIVYTTRQLQPGSDFYESGHYKFVGPSISLRKSDANEPDYSQLKKPLVYLSFGTILNIQADFFSAVLSEFKNFSGSVVLSVGKTIDIESICTIPSFSVVLGRVNQIEVLKNADVFITHGGMNSVHEGLYHGVPLVLIPFQEEQRTIAWRCAEMGFGVYLNRLDPKKIFQACLEVLGTPSFHSQAESVSKLLQSSGGAKEAADAVFAYKNSGFKIVRN